MELLGCNLRRHTTGAGGSGPHGNNHGDAAVAIRLPRHVAVRPRRTPDDGGICHTAIPKFGASVPHNSPQTHTDASTERFSWIPFDGRWSSGRVIGVVELPPTSAAFGCPTICGCGPRGHPRKSSQDNDSHLWTCLIPTEMSPTTPRNVTVSEEDSTAVRLSRCHLQYHCETIEHG